ncbi:NAD(P)-binding protein [Rhodotorula sp. JG-1b]|nr:NAD(P)-binding protein [Rhodotorula sp. JG-1b]
MAKTLAAISAHKHSPVDQAGLLPIQNPLRIATETAFHKTLYMPSRLTTSEGGATAVKVVAVPKPNCPVPGLPGTTLLMDEETGSVRAVVNSAELTGIRTATASALATKLLADPASQVLVIFGSGVQAYHHARLILELFPSITQVKIVVRRRSARASTLANNIATLFPTVTITLESSEEEAVAKAVETADIICTCVPSTTPLFKAESIKPGVHINAIGSYTPSMFEFPPDLISTSSSSSSSPARIPHVLVDSRSACLAESGELIAAHVTGDRLVELGELFDPAATGGAADDVDVDAVAKLRQNGVSLFKCVGIGGMDVAITRLVVEEAEKRGLGSVVPF